MEEDLDQIASGERTSFDFVREFYRGTTGRPGLEQRAQSDDQIPYPAVDVGTDPETDLPIRVRIGRFGPFLARGEGGDGHTASLPDEVAPADFTVDQAVDLLNAKAEGPRSLGVHPATGEKVYLLTGRYGPYVQLGEMPEKGAKGAKAPKPKRASLPKTLFSESTLTLDQALQLLGLPRQVGLHPDDGKPIVANFGPYSPYVKHNTDFRSLDSEAAVFEVTLDQAVELFRQPKQSRRQSVSRTVLNALGARPGTEKADAGAVGPLRSLRHRRDDARVAAEERRPGEDHDRRGGGTAQGAGSDGAAAEEGRPQGRRRRAASSRPQERASQGRLIGDSMEPVVQIVGAGLAGSEAAWQVASRGVRVVLHEMRPEKPTAVHKTAGCAELVCSNSFRGDKLDNAVGLLKEEMRRLGSLIMQAAETARVPAGAALAVDRDRFSAEVTTALAVHPLISIVRGEVPAIPPPRADGGPVIIATGPLTSDALSADLVRMVGAEHLYFYDAISPIVLAESIDRSKVFRASRWDRSLRGAAAERRLPRQRRGR